MPPNLLVHGVRPHAPPLPGADSRPLILKAAGGRPILEEGGDTGPPPAGAARAEMIFEVMGTGLIGLIVLAALWILIRKRL